jgi:hypothetical protein
LALAPVKAPRTYPNNSDSNNSPGIFAQLRAIKGGYDTFVKLVGGSKYMHMTGGNVVEPTDIPETIRHLEMTMSHILNSDKCFMGISLGYDAAMDTIDMAAILHGGKDVIKKSPALICLINSLTPLRYDARMLGSLHAYAETGQAMVIASLVMSGSTGPATLAGTLSLQNAEVLAGIALAQSINPGTPVYQWRRTGRNRHLSNQSKDAGVKSKSFGAKSLDGIVFTAGKSAVPGPRSAHVPCSPERSLLSSASHKTSLSAFRPTKSFRASWQPITSLFWGFFM